MGRMCSIHGENEKCGHSFYPENLKEGLYFLHNGPYVLVVQLFRSQSGWIPAGCGYSSNSLYLLDVCPCLDFVVVATLFSAWLSRKGIDIVVFSTLTVLGSEIVLFQALNPAGGLSLEVLESHVPS
jgi:hypothetical protein